MSELKIIIPDAVKNRVIDAMAYQYSYQDQIENEDGNLVDNPEKKPAFVKRMTIQWIKENVKAYESSSAVDTARKDALKKVDDDINLS